MTTTLSSGISVMNNAPMTALTMDALWQRLRHDAPLSEEISRLRKVKRLDATAYNRLKVALPFFCCATFSNGVRHSNSFVSVSAFVVDIDKYSGEVAHLETLRNRICSDERVALCFISPSGDGLKVVFTLSEPCVSLKEYSDFYKTFVADWAQKMDVSTFVDLRTTDATRACFLSHDALAFINPMSEPVVLEQYAPSVLSFDMGESNSVFTTATPLESISVVAVPKVATAPKTYAPDANCSHHIQPDAYASVLAVLKTKARPNPLQRATFVPEPLQHLMQPLMQVFTQQGISVLTVRDVQFGKQIQFQSNTDLAEINIYYGKKGFSVVLSTKKGTHPTFSELCVHLAEQTIFTM